MERHRGCDGHSPGGRPFRSHRASDEPNQPHWSNPCFRHKSLSGRQRPSVTACTATRCSAAWHCRIGEVWRERRIAPWPAFASDSAPREAWAGVRHYRATSPRNTANPIARAVDTAIAVFQTRPARQRRRCMKVGVTLFAQNYVDWERFEAVEADPSKEGLPQLVPDGQIYREQFHLGGLVEPLGFDSLWTVEHHFTPYTMITSPTQFLAYFAGQTQRIGMGTMIVVLPWHDPVQVAEGYIALDYMLDGRELKVGFGRGLGLREYTGMRVPMDESRERFKESLDIVRDAFTKEWFSYEGKYHQVPRTSMRPTPRPGNKLAENIYIAWGSPQS